MSGYYRRPNRRQVAEINVVPYIDVMLVLLVIFMITAPLLHTGVEIDLPEADAKPVETDPQNQEPLILTVNANGDWYLNVGQDPESPVDHQTAQRLAAAVIRLNPDKRVLVAGDTDVDYGQMMQSMVVLQKAGAKKIGLMADPPRQ
ncbi:MAG: protein TolR [Gammaproteobacteria bacterium]|nr:protein TolR [Gammaproteobacteria bacterium]